MRARLYFGYVIVIVSLTACERADGRAVMDDSTFVATMARLGAIDRRYELSEAARDSARQRVLQEQDLTPQDLERQARAYAANPTRASAIWAAISRRLNRPEAVGDSSDDETR